MKIVLYVAGMPFHGGTIKEGKSLGGSESAGYYIAKELKELGHEVVVFSCIQPDQSKIYDGVTYMPVGNMTEQHKLGDNFMQFAQNVPVDVLIIQRVQDGFLNRFKSKINLWWTHDIALNRSRPRVNAQLASINKVLAVSNWHKEQVQGVYKIQDRSIDVLPNAVDTSHYENLAIDAERKFNSKTLIFSSRPERGLENLVKHEGIMQKLWELDRDIKLFVTGYDNTTAQSEQYYKQLWERCQQLPNVTLLPPMSKQDLALIESNCSFYVYPTEFEETSCITAMHSQNSGTPFIASKYGALPETLAKAGVVWIAKDALDKVSTDEFANTIHSKFKNLRGYTQLVKSCLKHSENNTWAKSAKKLEKIIEEVFQERTQNPKALAKHFIKNSDILVCEKLFDDLPDLEEGIKRNYPQINGDYSQFYADVADYNTNEIKNTHRLGEDEYQLAMPRMQPIIQFLSMLPPGSNVLDYGCCVGQHTIAWARKFPHLIFTGIDISEEQVRIGNKYRGENEIQNLRFESKEKYGVFANFDAIICCEVLEHTVDPNNFLEELREYGKDQCKIIMSVPAGPWEEVRWDTQTVREHLHHFEYQDIVDMLSECKDFFVNYLPHDQNLGTHVFGFTKDVMNVINEIDYDRKVFIQNPGQTLSTCIITVNEAGSLEKTLKSVKGISEEIIVAVDCREKDDIDKPLESLLEKYKCNYFKSDSPMEIGFDAVRNKTIKKATSDWIFWIDSDELLCWPERLEFYLKDNNFDAYAIPQHHFSAEPAGKIKTDIPCRLFRNHLGIEFKGLVHEHPELVENEGIEHVMILPENHVSIMHYGYSTENTRRERFQRNFPLMIKDREQNPDRELGQFLWIRDLCHMNRFEMERTRQVTPAMHSRANEGMVLWRKFVKDGKVRFSIDSLEYISEFSALLKGPEVLEFSISMAANTMGVGDDMTQTPGSIRCKLQSKEDFKKLSEMIIDEKLNIIPDNYL